MPSAPSANRETAMSLITTANRISLRGRVIGGFGLLILLIAGMSIFNDGSVREVQENVTRIDAAAAVPDTAMLEWVRRAWNDAGLRLEPSAASGFAAVSLFLEATRNAGEALPPAAIHVVWTTGGSHLPEDQFTALLQGDAS